MGRPPQIDMNTEEAIAVLDRCGNNWKNHKGGCGPLIHTNYAPTLATMFQPFVIYKKTKWVKGNLGSEHVGYMSAKAKREKNQ